VNVVIVAAEDRALPPVGDMERGSYITVSPSYFEVLGISLIEGRAFDTGDDERAVDADRVMVINEALMKTFWPDTTALGKDIAFEFEGPREDVVPFGRRVVGVVGDVRHEGLRELPKHTIYVPYTQRPRYFDLKDSPPMTLFVKTREADVSIVDAVRQKILEIDPEQPIAEIISLEEILEQEVQVLENITFLVSFLALLAVLLAFVGVYGLIAYGVVAKTREIGLRMALGAAPRTILREQIAQSLGLAVTAMVIGGAILWVMPRVLSPELQRSLSTHFYGVDSSGPLFFFLVCGLLAVVVVGASLVPALRASRVDPAHALAGE
jgi:ABC-type lipoprotein release transport system permease subunit